MSDEYTIDFAGVKSYVRYNAMTATYGHPTIRLVMYYRTARKLGLVVSTSDTLPGRSLVHHTPTGQEVNVYAKRPMCYRRYLQRFKKLDDLFPNPVDLSHLF